MTVPYCFNPLGVDQKTTPSEKVITEIYLSIEYSGAYGDYTLTKQPLYLDTQNSNGHDIIEGKHTSWYPSSSSSSVQYMVLMLYPNSAYYYELAFYIWDTGSFLTIFSDTMTQFKDPWSAQGWYVADTGQDIDISFSFTSD